MQQYIEFVVNHWDLFLALAIILAVMFFAPLNSRLRGYKLIGPAEAVQLINHQQALFLDIRESSELKDGRINNSTHIPLGALKSRLGELEPYRQQSIIVGCRSGQRSSVACSQLRKAGFESVHNLKGGVMAWKSDGLPLTSPLSGKAKKRRKKKQEKSA